MPINKRVLELLHEEGGMTWFSLLIYKLVHEHAMYSQAEYIAVELGTNYGHSCLSILAGLESAKKGTLHSCDIEDFSKNENVRLSGLGHRWKFSQISSIDLAAEYADASVNFLFIDSSHEAAQTRQELALWMPKIKTGGYVLLHDTRSRPEGVLHPLLDYLATRLDWKFYDIAVDCGLGVLQKC